VIEAHDQKVTHRYIVRYPDHEAREHDPHYVDFHAYRRRTVDTAQCQFGVERGDFSECTLDKPLELHHAIIEFALMSAVDLKILATDFPGIDTPDEVGEWINSEHNLIYLCQFHHRGAGGIHVASASDYAASQYVRNMIAKVE
jgi:hypothetical protein